MKRYGSQLVQSLVAFDEGNYARAVDLLNPIRYEFINMAGSIAQVRQNANSIGSVNNTSNSADRKWNVN